MKVDFNIIDDATYERYMAHYEVWAPCTRCRIGSFARNHVFCRGTLPCDVLFIGEAPGVTEDLTGWPFVGEAGKILDRWIASAMESRFHALPHGHQIETVYHGLPEFTYAITNTVLCRPCNGPAERNRAPQGSESLNCSPRLEEFVDTIAQPKLIITLGTPARHAVESLLSLKVYREALRHPAWVLRQGGMYSVADRHEEAKLVEAVGRFLPYDGAANEG
jgi:uracil-DNA glycosylase